VPVTAALWWILRDPVRWLHVLFFCLILLPPLPIAWGNLGAHAAPLIVLLGCFIGLSRAAEWRRYTGRAPNSMFVFLAVIAASTALAALYSGPEVAAGSLARVLLFAIAVYVFLYTLCGPHPTDYNPASSLRWLYLIAMLGALFACIDFYFQLPAIGQFGPQFIWTDSGVFRRAQGLFYEASTLGNFCAFFVVMTMVAAFHASKPRIVPWPFLTAGFVLFSGALIFSYSRGSAANLMVATLAFLYVKRVRVRRLVVTAAIVAVSTAGLLRAALPEFFNLYFTRMAVSFQFLSESPDRVFSGRLATWETIRNFIWAHPSDLILGIGYKTLPYSHYAGNGIIADNTFLSLLVETGLIGLIVFLVLNLEILRTALRAARSAKESASFFGAWIFCFWCGELVQMLSGDLITYWRVLPLYFWALATAAREADA
jgi:O-antigen ligase